MHEKPSHILGRDRQWRSAQRFLFGGSDDGALRFGLLSGRRRTGKTQMLTALCRGVGGLYTACVQDEGDRAARTRFAAAISEHAGLGSTSRGEPESWERLLRAALETANRAAPTGAPPLVVIDEFPYAMANAPQLPSLVQQAYDDAQNGRGPGGHLILCGSALSVMHELLSGSKPLRGRAAMDMRMPELDYREAAGLWRVDNPEVALRVHACVGGIPGYRPLMSDPGSTIDNFDRWVVDNLLAVDVGVFTRTEVDYLLREDPRITSRAIYNDVLTAIANGATTPAKVGAAVGRDGNAVRYPIDVLESARYLTRTQDMLRGRKPTIAVADPIIRFDRMITSPHVQQLELGRAAQVWRAAAPTFNSNILGPHFETVSREWVNRFAPDELDRPAGFGDVGYATVHDNSGRANYDIDVIAVEQKHVTLIGEAKATLAQRGTGDLQRLDHIRDVLTGTGHNARASVLALFSATGFTPDLEKAASRRADVELVDLNRMYATGH